MIPLLLLLLIQHATFIGKVVEVHDGDTITVLHDNKAEKIRLFGVDCPEIKQAFGLEARAFTSDHVLGRVVKVVVHNKDRYGRTVGKVYFQNNEFCLNTELVRFGLAWYYKQYDKNDQELAKLEEMARRNKVGLWQQENPQAPWEFRKIHR